MAGHKMGGYVMVPEDWRAKPGSASKLIHRALAVTGAMPAKATRKAGSQKPARPPAKR